MFRTMSENHDRPRGKLNDHRSKHDKATHYNRGSDNEMIGAQSTFTRTFVDHGGPKPPSKIP